MGSKQKGCSVDMKGRNERKKKEKEKQTRKGEKKNG